MDDTDTSIYQALVLLYLGARFWEVPGLLADREFITRITHEKAPQSYQHNLRSRNGPTRVLTKVLRALLVRQKMQTPQGTAAKPTDFGNMSQMRTLFVEPKIRDLLGRLPKEDFEIISNQVIVFVNSLAEGQKDCTMLVNVTQVIYWSAIKGEQWNGLYARLCRKFVDQLDPSFRDDDYKDLGGNLVVGGRLFRKLLLNMCQDDFELEWAPKDEVNVAGVSEDQPDVGTATTGPDMKRSKTKFHGLALIAFMAQLFKAGVMIERIMHECIKKLLEDISSPKEEDIESLCKLLSTVGANLDTPRAKSHMDVYFSRIEKLREKSSIGSDMQSLLQNVVDLRNRNWVTESENTHPLNDPMDVRVCALARNS